MKNDRSLPFLPAYTLLAVLTTVVPVLHAADLQTISHGERVELQAHLVSGKLTLFDFYADWCGGCIQLDPVIKRYAAAYPEHLAVRKIDIDSWQSPVAEQYRLRAIPHLRLYDPDGELAAEGDGNTVMAVLDRQLVERAGARPELLGKQGGTSNGASFVVLAVAFLVVAALMLGSFRRRPAPSRQPSTPGRVAPLRPVTEQGWFVVLQGSLEGPFTPEQLRDMKSRSVLPPDARVRRLNDTSWRTIDQLES